MATPDVTLVGRLDTILGTAIAEEPPNTGVVVGGSVSIQLCGYGSQIPRLPGDGMFARITDEPPVLPSGYFTTFLFNNTLIEPDGTYYTVTIRDENGDIAQVNAYRFTVGGYVDISLATPYDPNQPPPPLPPLLTDQLLVVPWSATPEFPGDVFTTFRITLTGDVTSSTAPGTVQGNLYTFIIFQDAAGGHEFTWPSNCRNASPIDPSPNAITIQTFVMGLTLLVPISPATWIG
jgi:hypothetical protein